MKTFGCVFVCLLCFLGGAMLHAPVSKVVNLVVRAAK